MRHIYLNRTLCDVLSEMRDAYETRNFSYLLGLINEAQSFGNRMEAKLNDLHDIEDLHDQIKNLEKKRADLVEAVGELK